jgi:phage terminase small subunit
MQNDALLSKEILEKLEAGGQNFISSFCDLWNIFISAINDYNAGEIIYILDALDKCEDKGPSQITKALCKFY